MKTDFQSNPPPVCQGANRRTFIALNIELAGAFLLPPACVALQNLIKADAVRALEAQSLLVESVPAALNGFFTGPCAYATPGVNGIYASFTVTDFQRGLLTLEAELKRTGLLEHAEIGWLCPDELIWRRYWPKGDPAPFTAKILLDLDGRMGGRVVNTKLVQTLGWILQFAALPPPA